MKTIKEQLHEIKLTGIFTIFEIEVVNIKTGETDYIVCDIDAEPDIMTGEENIFATHVGLTSEEEESKFVARTSLPVDTDLCIDTHLQELHNWIIDKIHFGDLYDLPLNV